MKKVMKLTTVIALMFVAAISKASTPTLNLTSNSGKKVTFTMKTPMKDATIILSDEVGNEFFTEHISNQLTYSKRFDLSQLENGRFFLKVENALKKVIYTIDLNDDAVTIDEFKEVAKPVFKNTDKKLFVNLLNLDKTPVQFKVIGSNDHVLFKETITNEIVVEKVFSFDTIYKGSYTIVVSNGTGTYYKNVVVK